MYKRYSKLRFFDKNGNPFNFEYDEENESWKGTIHFPEVSIRLIENQTIFILEEFQDAPSPTFNVLLGKPHIDQAASDNILDAQVLQSGSSAFKVFEVDNPFNNNPVINFVEISEKEIVDEPSDVYDPVTERLITTNNVNKALRFDVAITSEDDGVHENKLRISDSVGIILELDLYGEIVGEDERLNVLLGNMGEQITEREEYIFRQSDINESLPNFKILNAKRKEMLVELHNISPYFSGYRGIINVIKYFGYFDLKLKEYWLNAETGKFAIEEVVLDELDKLDIKNRYMDYPYRKTSYFGLFYDLNRVVDGEFDDLGLPITEESFQFSNEEILIKLFGLKQYIKNRNIGGVSEIIDIIGEVTNFQKYDINVWRDQSVLQEVDLFIRPCFKCSAEYGYIQDIRGVLNDYSTCPLPRTDFTAGNTTQYRFGNYPQCFVGWFDPVNQDDPQFLDNRFIPVGFPITLTNCTFDLPWSACTFSWNSTNNANLTVTWENISHLNFYEIEWEVKRVLEFGDQRSFEYRQRGAVGTIEEVNVILPYTGFYDVTLRVYAFGGEVSSHTERCVEVDVREADFISYHRYYDSDLQVWESNYLSWNELNSEWNAIQFDNESFNIGSNDIKNRSFHIVNFLGTDSLGVKQVGIKPPAWNEFLSEDVSWNDYAYQTWNYLVHPLEKLARFVVTKLSANGQLQVGGDIYTMPSSINVNDFIVVANLLSQETGFDISNFWYTGRTVDPNVISTFIDAVAKLEGVDGDRYIGASGGVEIATEGNAYQTWLTNNEQWQNFPITWVNSNFAFKTNAIENPFTFDNVRIFKDRFDVPIMTPLFMVTDNSRMAGKSFATWTITNEDTGQVFVDLEEFAMVFRPVTAGNYSIEVTIVDTNGNTNKIKKTRHFKAWETAEYDNKLYVENVLNVAI